VPQAVFQQDQIYGRNGIATAEQGAGLQQANRFFPATVGDVRRRAVSSCWRSMKSAQTASGSLILPISCCHW
jgi:hypothetical protein